MQEFKVQQKWGNEILTKFIKALNVPEKQIQELTDNLEEVNVKTIHKNKGKNQ